MPYSTRISSRCEICHTKFDSDTPSECACGLTVGTVMKSKKSSQYYIVKKLKTTRRKYWSKYDQFTASFRGRRSSYYSRINDAIFNTNRINSLF